MAAESLLTTRPPPNAAPLQSTPSPIYLQARWLREEEEAEEEEAAAAAKATKDKKKASAKAPAKAPAKK